VLPAAGEVRYLKANPGADAKNALARLKAGGGVAATEEGVPPAQAEPGETAQEQTATATPTATPPVTTAPQTTTPQTVSPQAPVAAVPQPTTQTGQ
jgi:hypothetical protein